MMKSFPPPLNMPYILFFPLTIFIIIPSGTAPKSVFAEIDLALEPEENDVLISQIAPDKRGGKA